MNRPVSLVLAVVFALLLVSSASARDWWLESAPADTMDQQVVVRPKVAPPVKQGSTFVPIDNAVRVNWVDKYIEVVAGGTVDMNQAVNMAHALTIAKKTARHLAYEKLAETIRGIHIDADATYDRELMVDSNLRTKVDALVLGAQVIDETHEQFADGSIMAQVRLGIRIVGSDSLMAGTKDWLGKKDGIASGIGVSGGGTDHTGVIVMASGLKVKPAMTPRLVGTSGETLYGHKDVSQEYLVKYGLVGYAKSLEQAAKLERVGKNPLVLQASEVTGDYQCDLVLSPEEALKLKRLGAQALAESRVVFVAD